jgi:hypothetical protein
MTWRALSASPCEVVPTIKPEVQPGTGKGVCAITGDPVSCARVTKPEVTASKVGWLLRSSTRTTLCLLLLLRASVCGGY